MEEWKIGRMEDWKIGRLEEWKYPIPPSNLPPLQSSTPPSFHPSSLSFILPLDLVDR